MERQFFPYTAKEAKAAGLENVSEINRNSGFATRLRELRINAGLSQAKLADDLGIVKSTIGLYETGDTVPDARTLRKYADYFSVTGDYLLGLVNEPMPTADESKFIEKYGIEPESLEVFEFFKSFAGRHVETLGGVPAIGILNSIIQTESFCNAILEMSLAFSDFFKSPLAVYRETPAKMEEVKPGFIGVPIKEYSYLRYQIAREYVIWAYDDVWLGLCDLHGIDPHKTHAFEVGNDGK